MATNTPQEPGDVFRDLVTRWERDFNAFANKVMGTEEYSKAMNQAQKAQLGVQQMFSDGMARQLAAMNLPSRDDVVRLGESLHDITRRLERIEAMLADASGNAASNASGNASSNASSNATAKAPPRTRQPPQDYRPDTKPA